MMSHAGLEGDKEAIVDDGCAMKRSVTNGFFG